MAERRRIRLSPLLGVALLTGVAVHVALLALFTVRAGVDPRPVVRRPAAVVLPQDPKVTSLLLREQFELLDPAPLVSPTVWNAGDRPLPAALRRQPGEVFELLEARLFFSPERLKPAVLPPAVAPQNPRDALAREAVGAVGWEAFGRKDRGGAALEVRDAGVEVRRFSDGQVVIRASLTGLPDLLKQRDWEPVEYSVAVSPIGLVGVPSVAAGSGVEAVDAFFRDYLAGVFRLGERVPPGFYRVVVGR